MTDTQSIKDRIDIVQLIQEYVPLKKAGVNWKANCPFHQEKSPSFMAHQEKQIWHCFGCGKGGDIFSFIQEMEGLEFPEALKLLAERAGVKLDTFRSEVNQSQKNRLLEINSQAANFFYRFLTELPAAAAARNYLNQRGLAAETIRNWNLGYIPEQWDLLTQYLLKKGHELDDLVASGLTVRREDANSESGRGFYDRFRGRIMFPIADAHGNVVGFTGRIMVETERSGGKYVNTPQTIIYDKSRVIYGLYQAKSAIKSQDLAVVVEGQMDVISCHQQGMKNVVAASGTALTQNQVKLLRRYSNNVAICFDADSAGQNADKRGIAVALEEGMNVKVIRIPAAVGKDADEIIKKNPAVWFKAVAEAEGVMEWYFASVLTGLDRNNPQAMTKAANELIGEIVRLPQPVERDYWLRQLGERLDIEPGVLRDEAKKIRNTTARGQVRGAVNEPVKPAPAKIILRDERYNLLLEVWWALVLKFPELFGVFKDNPLADLFSSTAFSELYELCVSRYNNNEPLSPALLRLPLKDNSQPNLVDILLLRAEKDYADFTLPQARGEAERLMESIRREWIKNKRQRLQKQIEEAEKNNQPDKLRELWQEFQSLSLS